ncbi:MAG: glycosyltransferase [Candidatus Woesearchaeota archaeon]|nr:glycosyltransferase [Candidatus Woesearchaeota archaeon]
MKKVFFLVNSLEMGGAERVISEISPLLKDKFDVEILTLKSGKFYDIGVKQTSLLRSNSNLAMLFAFPYYVWKLRKIVKQNPDCKIVSFLEWSNFVNIFAVKNTTISLRIALSFFKGFKGAVYKFLISWLYPKAGLIIVNSEENKFDLAGRLNIDPSHIKVIYNPQDFGKIAKLKAEKVEPDFLELIKSKKVFISVGRLDKQKRYGVLINSFRKLVDSDTKKILVVIGDGPLKDKLELLIERLNLQENVFLIGRRTNVFKYLSKADYFIYSSSAEGFPNVLLEAMSVGLPIITSDFKTGGRELIAPGLEFYKEIEYPYYGPNGVLLSLNDFDLLSIELEKLEQNQEGIKRFDIGNVIKEWIKLLE